MALEEKPPNRAVPTSTAPLDNGTTAAPESCKKAAADISPPKAVQSASIALSTEEQVTEKPTANADSAQGAASASSASSASSVAGTNPEPPYSVFTTGEKYFFAVVLGFTGFWSGVSGNIYYPVLYVMKKDFHISEELSNVSVVLYFLLQGIAPTFTGSLADSIGRKPVIVMCCAIYIVACSCLAISNKYGLILFLRCVQAAGIAPVIAVCIGVSADIEVKSKRASLIGLMTGILLLSQSLGGLIGGLLDSGFGTWRAIFWFLAIGCGITMVVNWFIIPETKRSIVGNGSVPPKNPINKCLIWLLPRFRKRLTNDTSTLVQKTNETILRKLLDAPKILARKEVSLLLFSSGLYFAVWSMMFTSLSTVLQTKRGYTTRQVGLCFLAPGICGTIGSVSSGRILDLIFKRYTKKYLERKKLNPDEVFDYFHCRLLIIFPCAACMMGGILIFAWCLDKNVSLAGILIGSALASLVNSPFVSASTNLLADLYPNKASTAAAVVNFSRCSMAACGVAALSKMQSAMTIGGCYTFLTGLCLLSVINMYVVYKKGMKWSMEKSRIKQ